MKPFDGKVVIVTGGSSGIGAAAALFPPAHLDRAADCIQRLKRITDQERNAIIDRTVGSLTREEADEGARIIARRLVSSWMSTAESVLKKAAAVPVTGVFYMKNRPKNVLPFPTPPAEPLDATIIIQVGEDRFAIHWEIEELPPASPLVVWKRRAQKPPVKIVT